MRNYNIMLYTSRCLRFYYTNVNRTVMLFCYTLSEKSERQRASGTTVEFVDRIDFKVGGTNGRYNIIQSGAERGRLGREWKKAHARTPAACICRGSGNAQKSVTL